MGEERRSKQRATSRSAEAGGWGMRKPGVSGEQRARGPGHGHGERKPLVAPYLLQTDGAIQVRSQEEARRQRIAALVARPILKWVPPTT